MDSISDPRHGPLSAGQEWFSIHLDFGLFIMKAWGAPWDLLWSRWASYSWRFYWHLLFHKSAAQTTGRSPLAQAGVYFVFYSWCLSNCQCMRWIKLGRTLVLDVCVVVWKAFRSFVFHVKDVTELTIDSKKHITNSSIDCFHPQYVSN